MGRETVKCLGVECGMILGEEDDGGGWSLGACVFLGADTG